ncbi:MAG: hypothetical protein K0R26_2036 [Bacteroidota bacterium]|jgi:hypothetical protein|nr:hypothetical protein [Bacteroidota bacterium]
MESSRKPQAVQFIADDHLLRFIDEQAKHKPHNAMVQLLHKAVGAQPTTQDTLWWTVFLLTWVSADELAKKELIQAIANGSKLTKADAGRALENGAKAIKLLVDAGMQSGNLYDCGC